MFKDVIILIPSYEPDELLIQVVENLYKEGFPLLVVNDGSAKSYEETFNKIKDKASYIGYDTNRGKGHALKEGFKYIKDNFKEAKYIITVDGDGQHGLNDIKKIYSLLKEHDEFILGIRHFNKDVPFRSRFGNEWSKLSRCLVTKSYLDDDQCGLRGFPSRYLDELIKIRGQRYDYEMNQITLFQMKEYPIVITPIEVIYLDNNSRSHFSQFTDTVKIQLKIVINGGLALLTNLLMIGALYTLYYFHYDYHHLMILPVYLTFTLLYCLLLGLFNMHNRHFKKRFIKEIIYSLIKMIFVYMGLFLFVDAFKLSYSVTIPLLVVIANIYNLILPRLIKR